MRMNKEPYQPLPFRKGCKVLRLYEEPFTDRIGNKAIIAKADFIDKKGKEVLGHTLYVKWLEDEQ